MHSSYHNVCLEDNFKAWLFIKNVRRSYRVQFKNNCLSPRGNTKPQLFTSSQPELDSKAPTLRSPTAALPTGIVRLTLWLSKTFVFVRQLIKDWRQHVNRCWKTCFPHDQSGLFICYESSSLWFSVSFSFWTKGFARSSHSLCPLSAPRPCVPQVTNMW